MCDADCIWSLVLFLGCFYATVFAANLYNVHVTNTMLRYADSVLIIAQNIAYGKTYIHISNTPDLPSEYRFNYWLICDFIIRRTVKKDDKSMAMGILTFFMSFLGT